MTRQLSRGPAGTAVRKADVAPVGASLPFLFICNALNWIEGWVYFDWRGQIWAIPPSTKISLPVMKRLSSEARKVTSFATSAGNPFPPMGAGVGGWAEHAGNRGSSGPRSREPRGSTTPGATAFMERPLPLV